MNPTFIEFQDPMYRLPVFIDPFAVDAIKAYNDPTMEASYIYVSGEEFFVSGAAEDILATIEKYRASAEEAA